MFEKLKASISADWKKAKVPVLTMFAAAAKDYSEAHAKIMGTIGNLVMSGIEEVEGIDKDLIADIETLHGHLEAVNEDLGKISGKIQTHLQPAGAAGAASEGLKIVKGPPPLDALAGAAAGTTQQAAGQSAEPRRG